MALASYTIDATHSSVGFAVRHLVIAKVRGVFTRFTGSFAFDAEDLSKSQVTVTIDASSIDTREAQRDGHLKSADFFDVEKFKDLTFKSTRVEGTGSELKVTGELTMHGVTKEVTLDVEHEGTGKDPWGNERQGFSAKGAVNRKDFGLVWNQTLDAGGVALGEKVEISIDVEGIKDKAAA
jgi:polyisoprenoid-binding protein YceI